MDLKIFLPWHALPLTSPCPLHFLFALFQEIDPKIEMDDSEFLDGASQSLMSDIISSVPGIDEAMSFAELLK